MEKYFIGDSKEILKIPPFRDAHIHFTLDGKAASDEQLISIKNAYEGHGILQ